MSVHKLKTGKNIISSLSKLGNALEYFVKEEFPVEKISRNAAAVDIAWMSEEGQNFPLMIFEIESKATNSAANNPVKVFGQTNESFEKPLFFFHIFVQGSDNSSRVDNLKRLFGSHNYRTYRMNKDDSTRLVIDILSQHRRLYRSLNIRALIEALHSMTLTNLKIAEILIHVENLNFNSSFLKEYALLTLKDRTYKEHFVRFLSTYVNAHPKTIEIQEYGAYWGDWWSQPIHYGILIYSNLDKKGQYLNGFITWQEKSSYLSMIGPHLGQSRDYDEFILAMAPPFWAFLTLLMKSSSRAVCVKQVVAFAKLFSNIPAQFSHGLRRVIEAHSQP